MSSYDDYYSQWPVYVPVAQKKARAAKKLKALQKKGLSLQPVQIEGSKIARTFWGQSWCRNLESYSDYSNRLPRGRSYLRQGSVLDLKIGKGKIKAMVQGSSLYDIDISISSVPPQKWKDLVRECAGKIDSLIELLQGRFDKNIMEVMTRPKTGLFPQPAQIKFSCSCPDWAAMCKHVAAVLYGVGARLDAKPDLLFALRRVDHEDLVTRIDIKKTTGASRLPADDQRLDAQKLEEIFGINLAPQSLAPAASTPSPKKILVAAAAAAAKKVRRKRLSAKTSRKWTKRKK